MVSIIRQNYHDNCEGSINKQINLKLYASYVYMSLSCHFSRDDIALHGFGKFFGKSSKEERDHAMNLMMYQHRRGGRVRLLAVSAPTIEDWGSALSGLKVSFELEKNVNQSLLDLHVLASTHKDAHLTNYLEGDFLEQQVEIMKHLSDLSTRLNRAGPTGLGEHILDKELREESR